MAFAVGKWTQETCDRMIKTLFKRAKLPSPNNRIEIFTDGNSDYTHILPKYYPTFMNYGQLIKIREKGRVVGREKRVIYGNPNPTEIETIDVENSNGILRERVGRLVRKTKCFSKRKRRLEHAIHLFQFYWDFINQFKRNTSPAMLEDITDHIWTWHEFFYYKLTIPN